MSNIENIEEVLRQLAPTPDEVEEHPEEFPVRPLEDLISSWKTAMGVEGLSKWVLGDIALEAIRCARQRDPEKPEAAILKEFALCTGDEYQSMRSYTWVSKAFPTRAMRETDLSWTHYRKTVSTKDPMSWIQRAVDEHLTVRALEHLIAEAEGDVLKEIALCSKCLKTLPENGQLKIYRDGKEEVRLCSDECALTYFSDLLTQKARIFGSCNNTDTDDLSIIEVREEVDAFA